MQKNLRSRIAASLILSAVLFVFPAGAFLGNRANSVQVYAEGDSVSGNDAGAESGGSGEEETEGEKGGSQEEASESEMDGSQEGGGESEKGGGQEEESGENESGSGQEDGAEGEGDGETETEPEAVCACDSKCTRYDYDRDCPVCSEDYGKCAYREPSVKITIHAPSGWYSGGTAAKVTFQVADIANTGNFAVQSVKAKIGQNGSYQEVTEDMSLEISENCSVYVLVTDAGGRSYERSRSIRCFDTVKPTLNAAVSDGLLTIQAVDHDSGVKTVYVNGYEFTDVTNGTVNIRLSQFDAGYEYFTISAMDAAGNMSEVYKTKNPYYKDPESEDDDDPAKQLPVSAEPTKPSSATAQVTEHTKTDADGNKVDQAQGTSGTRTPEEQKKAEFAKADAEEEALENGEAGGGDMNQGKEFYTIQAASGKVFYLVIDRDGEEETVYFLTEITENDLLNVTGDNAETLPKNSAALESQIPVTESALPNNNAGTAAAGGEEEPQEPEPPEGGTEEPAGDGTETEEPQEAAKGNPIAGYLLIGILGACVVGAAYYFKVVRKKQDGDFVEDEEEDEYEADEPVNEDEDDFFDGEPEDDDGAGDAEDAAESGGLEPDPDEE